ncbi:MULTISPECIES: hypothetical protein [Nocardiopsidaceae]|uniref:Uncharacterized protein n=1 Tax=Streptomonospora nanhaiensis TaxID=1323731 RepID=A0ABY6YNT0_9ACTN|nr:hypothetical protein [Streptomonospora nanhaiensis]WAE73918.1 hypothetical protein OUQ99_01965 [Streptomonospora nanhaiensis]
MTAAAVLAVAAALLAAARLFLNGRHPDRGVHSPGGTAEEALTADAGRSLERAAEFGAFEGHLWAWRDLLSDTAAALSGADTEPPGGGTAEAEDDRRREPDSAEQRLRSALSPLAESREAGTAGVDSGGSGPWSG